MIAYLILAIFILAVTGGAGYYYGYQAGKVAESGKYKSKIKIKQVQTVDEDE